MKRFISSLFLCVCSFSFLWAETATVGVASPAKPKDYLACFTQWDQQLHSLKTHFVQTTQYDGLLISQSEGNLFYKQEGTWLRLDNMQGQDITQTALTDKKKIWILDEKGKEISTLSWQEWSAGQPNKALFDFGNYTALIAKHDTVILEYKQDTVLLKLTPKQKKENYTLQVTIRQDTCFPTDITIISDLMQTSAALSDVNINAALNQDVFKRIK